MYFIHQNLRNESPPQRIISLVPSQTELLFHLGLEQETVGITKFCVHPAQWFKNKTRIGGTKTVDYQKVKNLKPDLILANQEENLKDQVEALQDLAPVWVSDIHTLSDALIMIRSIGELTQKQHKADHIAKEIEEAFTTLLPLPLQEVSALYLIWREPWMSVGRDTFIHDMMQHIGFKNVMGDQLRYPELSLKDIQERNPQIVLLSSEPFPFKEKHLSELQQILPDTKIMLVDGEMFSWYGSRLIAAPAYFKNQFKDYF